MEPLPRWRRLLMSTPGAIIVQTLTILTIILLVYRPRYFSWVNVLAISFFYGVVMTIVVKTYAQKYSKSLGLSGQQQVGMLAEAIKKAEIPANPELERALPAFIDRRMKFIERQRRFLPFSYVLFGLGFLQSIFTRDLFEMSSFGLVLGFCIYSYFYYKKTESNVAVLQAELEKRGVKLSSEAERKK